MFDQHVMSVYLKCLPNGGWDSSQGSGIVSHANTFYFLYGFVLINVCLYIATTGSEGHRAEAKEVGSCQLQR